MGLSKIKNFCISKDTTKKEKGQSPGWEKIFVSHISGKGFLSRIYEEHVQLNNKKTDH